MEAEVRARGTLLSKQQQQQQQQKQTSTVHVLCPNDMTVSLCLASTPLSAGDVKKALERELNIPAERQSFVGIASDDHVVGDNASLELRVHLKGGCGGAMFSFSCFFFFFFFLFFATTVECCGCTWYGPCVKRECGDFEIYFPCTIQ